MNLPSIHTIHPYLYHTQNPYPFPLIYIHPNIIIHLHYYPYRPYYIYSHSLSIYSCISSNTTCNPTLLILPRNSYYSLYIFNSLHKYLYKSLKLILFLLPNSWLTYHHISLLKLQHSCLFLTLTCILLTELLPYFRFL